MLKSEDLLHQIKDYKPQTDISRMKDFIGSELHLDFRNEVVARILSIKDTFGDMSVNGDRDNLMRTQGGIMSLELVLNIFENLLSNKESDLKHEELENERDE
jgi:hypothetical protein